MSTAPTARLAAEVVTLRALVDQAAALVTALAQSGGTVYDAAHRSATDALLAALADYVAEYCRPRRCAACGIVKPETAFRRPTGGHYVQGALTVRCVACIDARRVTPATLRAVKRNAALMLQKRAASGWYGRTVDLRPAHTTEG